MVTLIDIQLTVAGSQEKRLVPNIHDGISYDQFMLQLGELLHIEDINHFGLSYYHSEAHALLVITSDVEWRHAVRTNFSELRSMVYTSPVSIYLYRRVAQVPGKNERMYTVEQWDALTASRDALQATNTAQATELAKHKESQTAQAAQIERLIEANMAQSQAFLAAREPAAPEPAAPEPAAPAVEVKQEFERPRKLARKDA